MITSHDIRSSCSKTQLLEKLNNIHELICLCTAYIKDEKRFMEFKNGSYYGLPSQINRIEKYRRIRSRLKKYFNNTLEKIIKY